MKKLIKNLYKSWNEEEAKYALNVYTPSKNSVKCVVNGTEYQSKAQACVLEGITISELNEYLKNN
jgi:hypothetical protein